MALSFAKKNAIAAALGHLWDGRHDRYDLTRKVVEAASPSGGLERAGPRQREEWSRQSAFGRTFPRPPRYPLKKTCLMALSFAKKTPLAAVLGY
jgi:hypothetical protein